MTSSTIQRAATLAALCTLTTTAFASWPLDPLVNVGVCTQAAEQTLPKIAATPDGGCYIGWHDLRNGNYDLYLQKLDRTGTPQWAANGIAVSTQPQPSSLVDWAMATAANGDALIIYTDSRAGSDRDAYAYRVSPSGAAVWGAAGVTLSVNDDFEAAPKIAELSDGTVICVWPVMPTSDGRILAQRLSAGGAPLYASPRVIASSPPENPSFCEVVASNGGNFIVSWVRDTRTFASPRHVQAMGFDSEASPLWGAAPLEIYNETVVPIAYTPKLITDEAGGAVVLWHRSLLNRFNCAIQHIRSDGSLVYPANGLTVTPDTVQNHLDPAAAYDPATGDTYVFWNNRNSAQSQWGIRVQRLTQAGTREFGTMGLEIEPLNATNKSLPRAVSMPDGAAAMYYYATSGTTAEIRGVRVRAGGAFVWTPTPTPVATSVSDKSRTPIALSSENAIISAWEDARAGNRDIYAQAVQAGGALGVLGDLNCDGATSVGDIAGFVLAVTNAAQYAATYPGCDPRLADINGDGVVSVGDIGAFVTLLAGL